MTLVASQLTAGESIQFNLHYHQATEGPPPPGTEEPSDLIPQFDSVKAYLDRQQLTAAAAVLDRMEREHAGRFTAYTWYRYFAFKGHLSRFRGQYEEAAGYYFRAKERRPDLENAQCFEVLGYLMLQQDAKAFELATALRNRYPASSQAMSLFVQTAPLSMQIAELEANADSVPAKSAEVDVALAQAAYERDDYIRAKTHAKRGIEKDPGWIQAKTLWAAMVVMQHRGHPSISEEDARQELGEARTVLQDCITTMRADCPPLSVAHQYVNLAGANRLFGDHAAADQAIAEAKRLAPEDEDVRVQNASVLLRSGNLDSALAELASGLESAPVRRQLIWAQIRSQRNKGSDRIEARDLLARHLNSLADAPCASSQLA